MTLSSMKLYLMWKPGLAGRRKDENKAKPGGENAIDRVKTVGIACVLGIFTLFLTSSF